MQVELPPDRRVHLSGSEPSGQISGRGGSGTLSRETKSR